MTAAWNWARTRHIGQREETSVHLGDDGPFREPSSRRCRGSDSTSARQMSILTVGRLLRGDDIGLGGGLVRWGKLVAVGVLLSSIAWAPGPAGATCAAGVGSNTDNGYWLVGADGGIFTFGTAGFWGSDAGRHPGDPAVGMTMGAVPSGGGNSSGGYFVAHRSGEVDFFPSNGSGSPEPAAAAQAGLSVVGISANLAQPDYYFMATADGRVLVGGGASSYGDASHLKLDAPIVGIAASNAGHGYWLVGRDGGVFSFGAAAFHGSAVPLHLSSPVVGIIDTPDDGGYWLVTAAGGVYTFGDAQFYGAEAGQPLKAPVVGLMSSWPQYNGYWLVDSAGGVRPYGQAPSHGSMSGRPLASPIVGGQASLPTPVQCPS